MEYRHLTRILSYFLNVILPILHVAALSSRIQISFKRQTEQPISLKRRRLGMDQWVLELPRLLRGTDPIRRSAVYLGNQGASLLI